MRCKPDDIPHTIKIFAYPDLQCKINTLDLYLICKFCNNIII